MMSRRAIVAGAAGALASAVLIAVALWLTVGDHGGGRPVVQPVDTGTMAPTPTPSAPALTAADAAALSTALASGDDRQIRAVLAVPSGAKLDPAAAAGLANLAPISFDPATFNVTGPAIATVVGTVARPPAGLPSRWTFHLLAVDHVWRLVGADPTA